MFFAGLNKRAIHRWIKGEPMGVQSETFLAGEADAWWGRNRFKSRLPDPVISVIGKLDIKPNGWIVEVGCGDGWRLDALQRMFQVPCTGIDTSANAISRAYDRRNPSAGYAVGQYAHHHTAALKGEVGLFIFGFCLYVMDREDLFSIAMAADHCVKDGGRIIVHDFFPDYPCRRAYAHKEGLFSYKMDYSKLWTGNPAYHLEHVTLMGNGDDRTGVAVIRKNLASAYPQVEP